jgi:hypothetical protein
MGCHAHWPRTTGAESPANHQPVALHIDTLTYHVTAKLLSAINPAPIIVVLPILPSGLNVLPPINSPIR